MTLRLPFSFFLLLIISGTARAQNLEWVHQLGDQNRCISHDLTIDSASNVYTVGTFRGTIDFDPDPMDSLVLSATGNADLFLSKHDSSGSLLWAYAFSSSLDYELGRKVATDAEGNVYVCGLFRGIMDVDPDTSTFTLQDSGLVDAFILKLDSAGALLWAKNIGRGAATVSPAGLAVGPDDFIYLTGYFTDTVDLDPGPGTDLFFGGGAFSFTELGFVGKYDSNGNYVWGRKFGGEHSQSMRTVSLSADPFGNVFVGGQFKGRQDFDGGPDSLILVSTGKDDLFLTKLNPQGNINWIRQYLGSSDRFLTDMTCDYQGNIYLTGRFNGFFDIDPGPATDSLLGVVNTESYFTSLDSAGTHRFGRAIISNNTSRASAIAVDQNQFIYIGGEFTQTLDADPGPGQANITARAGVDAYLGIYDQFGNYRAIRHIAKNAGNAFNRGIAVDKSGNIFSTGSFTWLCDFDPRPNDSLMLTPAGVEDIYIHKMIPCRPKFVSVSDTACDSLIAPSGSTIWYQSGIYQDTLADQNGCDSIITINLSINTIARDTLNLSACDSLLGPGHLGWLSTSGTYRDTLSRPNACDSIILLNLTIYASTHDTLSLNTCDSLRSPSGNQLFLQSGFYVDSLQTIHGCDSLIYIDLQLANSSQDTFSIVACDSLLAPNGAWRSSSGLYLDSLLGQAGCDSIVYTDLTIYNSSIQLIQDTACDFYASPTSTKIWTSSGTYFDTLSTQNGCDSVLAYQLQINRSNLDTITINSCEAYLSPSGRYTYRQSGFYRDTLATNQACDSILAINFLLTEIDTSLSIGFGQLSSNQNSAQYQWLDCNAGFSPIAGATSQSFQASSNGRYAAEITLNNCVDTSNCALINDIGLPTALSSGIRVYPNPFNRLINLEIPPSEASVLVQLTDLQGRLILRQSHLNPSKIQLKPELPKGLYLLSVSTEYWQSQTILIRD